MVHEVFDGYQPPPDDDEPRDAARETIDDVKTEFGR
jgi:hypothetical protein